MRTHIHTATARNVCIVTVVCMSHDPSPALKGRLWGYVEAVAKQRQMKRRGIGTLPIPNHEPPFTAYLHASPVRREGNRE
jgi:hypothetical protein